MINWWVALIISVATMVIGYGIGLMRAFDVYLVCRQALEETEAKLKEARECICAMAAQMEMIKNELESEGSSGRA